jgi:hypothetical protein
MLVKSPYVDTDSNSTITLLTYYGKGTFSDHPSRVFCGSCLCSAYQGIWSHKIWYLCSGSSSNLRSSQSCLISFVQGVVNYGTKITGASADITVPECRVGTPNTTYSTYTSDGWVGISAYRGPDDAASYGLLQTGSYMPTMLIVNARIVVSI